MGQDVGNFHWTYSNQGVGSLPSAAGGTFTAQIRKTGRQATFEILRSGNSRPRAGDRHPQCPEGNFLRGIPKVGASGAGAS